MVDTLQGLVPGLLAFSAAQKGLTAAIALNVPLVGPDLSPGGVVCVESRVSDIELIFTPLWHVIYNIR